MTKFGMGGEFAVAGAAAATGFDHVESGAEDCPRPRGDAETAIDPLFSAIRTIAGA